MQFADFSFIFHKILEIQKCVKTKTLFILRNSLE